MRAGKLDTTVRIDTYDAEAVNDFGTAAPAYTPLATMRAQVIQASTDEFIRNGAVEESVVVFRTRWLAGVTASCRVHHGGEYFNVKEIREIGRRKGLELRAVRQA